MTPATCPRHGWGHLTFTDASPAPGKAYTDDGQVHEHRGLKGRTKGRPSPRARRPVRKVPIPPELVELLCAPHRHVRHRTGRPAVPLRKRQPAPAVHLVAGLAESPRRLAHPPAARLAADEAPLRPAALRRSPGGSTPASPTPEVAAWAGHCVEMLMRVYARLRSGPGRRVDRPHGQDPATRKRTDDLGERMGDGSRPQTASGGIAVSEDVKQPTNETAGQGQ